MILKFEASSNIVSAELEPKSGRVEVTFRSGAAYRYAGGSRELLEEWRKATSAGVWFQRNLKRHPIAACMACDMRPRFGAALATGLCEACEARVIASALEVVKPDVGIAKPISGTCQHVMLCELNGGVCPVCPSDKTDTTPPPVQLIGHVPDRDETSVPSSPDRQIIPIGNQAAPIPGFFPFGKPPEAPPIPIGMIGAAVAGELPLPNAYVRPALVESPPHPLTPSAVVHGPHTTSAEVHGPGNPPPAHLRRALTTLTRAEATRLLTRLQARRMTNDLREFIKGAWHVLEGEMRLEWNFHHDAFCEHAQTMVEEWYLAGLPAEKVGPTLDEWEQAGRPYVAGERAHWLGKCEGGVYKQRASDLAVNVGPISLKSRVFMVFLPAWVWLWVADWQVFCTSGTPSNVSRDSLACRDLVTHAWYRDTFGIEWTIRQDQDRIENWATTAGGARQSRGAGGAVTGLHIDCALLDDPDDAASVWSEAERRDIMLFWLALGNRFKDLKRPLRFIVQQNLHEEDLSTRTVATGMPRLAIPVEFDPARRTVLYTAPYGWRDPRELVGALIHPERFPPEVLQAERTRLGTHGFEAQYNCNPRPLEGGMIKRSWFRFFRVEDDTVEDMRPRPTGCVPREKSPALTLGHKIVPGRKKGPIDLDWLTITVDATFGATKETSSAVGLLAVGGKALRRFVFEDKTEPMTFHATCDAVKSMLGRWPARRVLIELKANGAAIIEELTKQIGDGKIKGPDGFPISVVIEPINPEGGKESRAAAMVPAIEAGTVYLLDGAHWLEDFVGEVCVFPNAKRDDRVDALSQLMTYYRAADTTSKWQRAFGRGR